MAPLGKQKSSLFSFIFFFFSNAFILRPGEFVGVAPPSSGQQTRLLGVTWISRICPRTWLASLTKACSARLVKHRGVSAHTLVTPFCVEAPLKRVPADSWVFRAFVSINVARDTFPGVLAEARAVDVVT